MLALQLLSAPGKLYLEEALIALINRLARMSSPWVLVLDEYQVIREPAIHDQLSYLVEHLPSHVHVLLAARKDPPLPLSRWRVRGQLQEVRIDQLRATVEEAGTLLRQMVPFKLERSLLQEITARTEGWLAALRLVGLSLRGRADLAGVLEELAELSYILDYVTEEVLQQQEPAVSTFLLRTSILSQLTASLCDAVLERTDSQQVLEELERSNMFVVPLVPHRCYRYHALFAEVLRVRLEQENGEDVLMLHLRASNWYAQHGHTASAVQHALLAHAWQQAADLIESISQVHAAGTIHEESIILSWIVKLPAEILRGRPQLCQIFTGNMTGTGGPPAHESWQQQRPLSRMHALAPFTEDQREISGDQNQHHLQEPVPSQDRVRAIFPSHERPFEGQHWSWGEPEPGLLLLDPLSAREREVIGLVAQGYTNQEIAEALVVEVNTVKRHVGNIFSKLQVHGRIQAVIQARALGLLTEVA